MGEITSLFVHKVAAQVEPDVDTRALLRDMGFDPDADVDPSKMVSTSQYYRFLEQLTELDKGAVPISLRVGQSMRCEEYGAFGLAWKSAPTLHGSFYRAERYARVLSSVASYDVLEDGDDLLFRHHRVGSPCLGMSVSNENTVASIYAICQEVATQEFALLEVSFRHSSWARVGAYEDHFGCPVRFDADLDAVRVSKSAAQLPNKLGDKSISHFFEQHLAGQVAELNDADSLGHRVQAQISQALSSGVPSVSEVANGMGMSARTLQRRLAESDMAFLSLVDEARRQLSVKLLRDTKYSLAEVSFLTGFSDQSAFSRAFKRWHGKTPRSFRLSPISSESG